MDIREEIKVNINLESYRKKREEKQKDKQLIAELKKEMPATESQNLREIDNITMPSSRKPVRAQEVQSREKS